MIVLFLSGQLISQEKDVDTEPGTAFYLELGGKLFYSVNIDFRINKSNRFGFGIQPVYGIIPNVMYYHLRGGNAKFEIGGGLSVIHSGSEKFTGVLIHGVIGYRYQKKNGLLFRAGFTPVIHSGGFLPWIGVSIGYSL